MTTRKESARCAGVSRSRSRPSTTYPSRRSAATRADSASDRREVRRRYVPCDLVQGIDLVLAQLLRMRADDLLVRRFVDAVRPDEAFVVDDDVAVLPRDLGGVGLGGVARAAPHGGD